MQPTPRALTPQDEPRQRKDVTAMNDRELAEETVVLLRGFYDALEQLGSNPLLKRMIPGL